MEAVEGAVLYSSFDVLFGKASSEVNTFERQNRLLTELDKLRKLLVCICGVLNDAEGKHLSGRSIRIWLREAKHLMYEAENICGRVGYPSFETRQTPIEGWGGSQFTTSKVSCPIPPFCTSLVLNGGIRSRLRRIITLLEAISAQIDELGLEKGAAGTGSVSGGSSSTPSVPLMEETVIYGREYDK